MMAPFEERPVFSAKMDNLESERFNVYYEVRYDMQREVAGVTYDRLLQNLKLAAQDESGAFYPTGLGALLFASRPEQWVSGAYVDIVAYEGESADADKQRDAKIIRGTVSCLPVRGCSRKNTETRCHHT